MRPLKLELLKLIANSDVIDVATALNKLKAIYVNEGQCNEKEFKKHFRALMDNDLIAKVDDDNYKITDFGNESLSKYF